MVHGVRIFSGKIGINRDNASVNKPSVHIISILQKCEFQ